MRLTLRRDGKGSRVINADTGEELSVLKWSLSDAGDSDSLTITTLIDYDVPALQPGFRRLPMDSVAWALLEMIHGREKMEAVLAMPRVTGPFFEMDWPQHNAAIVLVRDAFGILSKAFGQPNPYEAPAEPAAEAGTEAEKTWREKESLL